MNLENGKHMMRFQAKILEPNADGFLPVELTVTHKLNREDGLRYAKANNIPVVSESEFTGLDISDPYSFTTKSKTKEKAMEEIKAFITDFTKSIEKDVGKTTLVDYKTGKIVDSESNL